MTSSFTTQVPSKWILAGEHAVIRGGKAIALPSWENQLRFEFEPGHDFQIDPPSFASIAEALLDQIRSHLQDSGCDPGIPRGKIKIQSTIPQGSGLGSSAAVSVALARWAQVFSGFPEEKIPWLATQLENHFHGKSSGLDVQAVSAGEPIVFDREKGARRLGLRSLPKFTLQDTGLRMSTRFAIERVAELASENLGRSQELDGKMAAAATQAENALREWEGSVGENAQVSRAALRTLAGAMEQAQACFDAWGLTPPEVLPMIQKLRAQGALAAKITGAGGGGFLVALWEK